MNIISSSFFLNEERWVAGQEVGRNAEDSGKRREGIGESKRRVDQKLSRDREVTAPDTDDSRRAECQGETNQRTSRVSIKQHLQIFYEILYVTLTTRFLFTVHSKPHKPS